MTDPKPPVSHKRAREWAEMSGTTRWDGEGQHDLLDYIDQQEAAERERNLEREGASFVNDGLRAKLQAAEHFVEQHRAGCPRHAAIYAAERERDSMRMQRDVFQEKLNEYIDKTKEAEKRTEEAERALTEMPSWCVVGYREGYPVFIDANSEAGSIDGLALAKFAPEASLEGWYTTKAQVEQLRASGAITSSPQAAHSERPPKP